MANSKSSDDEALDEVRDAIERVHYGAAYPEIVRLRKEGTALARRLRAALNTLETIARGEAWDPRETARYYLESFK
jgi:hypothetical protein